MTALKTSSQVRLPPMPQDGPVEPADYPEGIEWEDYEIDQRTGEAVAVCRVISVEDWNCDHAWPADQAKAFAELAATEKERPYRFSDHDAVPRIYGDGKAVSLLVREISQRRGFQLEELQDHLKEVPGIPVWVRRHLRHAIRLVLAELAAARETILALRQRVAELEAALKACRSAAPVAAEKRECLLQG